MPRYAIIVDRLSDWKGPAEGFNLISADAFLTNKTKHKRRPARVINLCRHYDYLSAGYYCSLLAEARGQIPMPTVADVLSLQRKNLYAFALAELNTILNRIIKRLADAPESSFSLTVFFGKPDDSRFKRLAAECFDTFRYPILQLDIKPGKRWEISAIRPLGLHQVPGDLATMFYDAMRTYTRTRKELSGGRPPAQYNLAILYDPDEALPPSDAAAFEKFRRVGQGLRMDVELITKKDYRRLPEFDALFIRTNTSIDHYTYQFAKKAEQEGLVVIDDPTSILRCTNKVYLHELLQRHGLPTPKSRVVNRLDFGPETAAELEAELGYPIILKIPDGSFSRGMHKAETRQQVLDGGADLLKSSRLILAQEFVYTPFDWRVGVLRGEPLYVCQYLMSRNHWQIVNHGKDGSFRQGGWKTFAVEDAPAEVVEVARKAAHLIGDGLYGVDLKQTDKGLMIIEVNDNPSLETQVEDKVLKDELYERILKEFIRRIDGAA
ncbi:RimK family protein [Magnetovibrio sp.]|uniref:RimK family protein n=1 Tax=Magnetovibrio sp. TaxID=2024836 RepID=UPI002F9584EF